MAIERGELMWAALFPSGQVVPWVGAMSTRKMTIHRAVQCCMSATAYDELGNDSARWQHCYRRGYRIIRVRLVPADGGE